MAKRRATTVPARVAKATLRAFEAHAAGDEEGLVGAIERVIDDVAIDAAVRRLCAEAGVAEGSSFRTAVRRIAASTFMTDPETGSGVAQLSLFAIPCDPRGVEEIDDPATRRALAAALTGSGAFKADSVVAVSPVPVVLGWLSGAPAWVLRRTLRMLLEPCVEAFETGRPVDDAGLDVRNLEVASLVGTTAYVAPVAVVGLRLMPTGGRCPCCGLVGDLLYGMDKAGAGGREARRRFAEAVAASPNLGWLGPDAPSDVFEASSTITAREAIAAIGASGADNDVVHALVAGGEVAVAARRGSSTFGPRWFPGQLSEADPEAFVAALGRNVKLHADAASLQRALGA